MPSLSSYAAVVCLVLFSEAVSSQDARTFCVRDVNGIEQRPFADAKTKAVTLLFVLADCPIANGYAPEIQRLYADFGPRGVRFLVVHVDPDATPVDARRHAQEFGYTCPVVVDGEHRLVRQAGVVKVPTAAVFAPNGERKYLGRINDLYVALGKRRSQPTTHDLRDALDALLAGQALPRAMTDVVGCPVPPLATKGR